MTEWSGYFDTPREHGCREFVNAGPNAVCTVKSAREGKASQEVLLLRGG